MTLLDMLSFFSVMAVLALIPSTSVALVVARSSMSGFSSGLAVVAGIVAGDLFFVCLALFGMVALSETLGTLFLLMRFAAAAYLIWFGTTLLRSRSSGIAGLNPPGPGTLWSGFLSGLMITLGDIKAIFFYASLFPAFVDLEDLSFRDVGIIMLLTIITVGGVKAGYAIAARKVTAIATGLQLERGIKWIAGTLMIGAGLYLASKALN